MQVFDNVSNEMKKFHEKIRNFLQELMGKSELGLVPYYVIEEKVMNGCKQEITMFSNNAAQLKKMIKQIALEGKMLIINLLSNVYLFSLEHYLTNNTSDKEFMDKLMIRCVQDSYSPNITAESGPVIEESLQIKLDNYDKFEEDINAQIDINKIVVVDNEKALAIAKEYMKDATDLAVDLEGNLEKDGRLELIQVSCKDKIFIFDLYSLKINLENSKGIESAEYLTFAKEMTSFIKYLMESESIVKVFHDCRKDSLALHLFLKCCPRNVLDVSALHTFNQHLEKYLAFSDALHLHEVNKGSEKGGKKKEKKAHEELSVETLIEIQKSVEDIRPPGLNDIFEEYSASHGINKLKNIMKKRFNNFPREYFLQRPIDIEFLVYSAKDVEDLVEVKDKALSKLKDVLARIYGEVDENKVLQLGYQISKSYCHYGWVADLHNGL